MAYPSVGNIFNPLQNNATGNIQSAFPTAMKPVMPTPAPSVSAPISTPPVSSKVSKKIPKDKYQKMLDDAQKEGVSKEQIDSEIKKMGYEIEGAAVQKAVDVAKDIAITAGATELAGRSLKGIGKTIYGLSTRPTDIEKTAMQKYKARAPYSDKLFGIGKPRTVVDTSLNAPWFTKNNPLGGNMIGMEGGIGVDARANADRTWAKVEPLLQNSKSTVNVQQSIKELGDEIPKMAGLEPGKIKAYEQAFSKLIKDYADPKYANMSMKDVNTLKSGLQGRTPKISFKGQELADELKELYSRLSGKLVEKVHSTLGSEFGKDTAKIYKDYANFDEMAKTAIAETKGKQLPTSVSSLISRLGKPVTSTVGATLYRAGKILSNPVEIAKDFANGLKSAAKAAPEEIPAFFKGVLKNIKGTGSLPELLTKGGKVTKAFSGGGVIALLQMLAPDEETKQAVANMPENVAWQRLLEQQKVHDRKKKGLSPEKSVITI